MLAGRFRLSTANARGTLQGGFEAVTLIKTIDCNHFAGGTKIQCMSESIQGDSSVATVGNGRDSQWIEHCFILQNRA